MKQLNKIQPDLEKDGEEYYSKKTIQTIGAEAIAHILRENQGINVDDVNAVGIIEGGKIQFAVKSSVRDRQIIIALGLLKWLFGLQADQEVENEAD